jgi:transposase
VADLMQIATELGISPSMLRNWRAVVNGATPRSRGGSRAPAPDAPPMTSPADQAAEIARLRRELDRMRMERDVLKNRRGLGPPVGSETACW